ncbi:MAG: PilZ domain-containing protein [Planctomycetota bacterium]|nr:MAG: PilZ domain-containing protein [Planctomycetota bacterium]
MNMEPFTERRAHPRRKLLVKMELHIPDTATGEEPRKPGEPVMKCAFSRNVSAGGVLVLLPEPLPPGTNIRVLIPFHGHNTTVALAGEVTRCVELETGHEVALKFLDPDPHAVEVIEQYVLKD